MRGQDGVDLALMFRSGLRVGWVVTMASLFPIIAVLILAIYVSETTTVEQIINQQRKIIMKQKHKPTSLHVMDNKIVILIQQDCNCKTTRKQRYKNANCFTVHCAKLKNLVRLQNR